MDSLTAPEPLARFRGLDFLRPTVLRVFTDRVEFQSNEDGHVVTRSLGLDHISRIVLEEGPGLSNLVVEDWAGRQYPVNLVERSDARLAKAFIENIRDAE